MKCGAHQVSDSSKGSRIRPTPLPPAVTLSRQSVICVTVVSTTKTRKVALVDAASDMTDIAANMRCEHTAHRWPFRRAASPDKPHRPRFRIRLHPHLALKQPDQAQRRRVLAGNAHLPQRIGEISGREVFSRSMRSYACARCASAASGVTLSSMARHCARSGSRT